MPNLGTLLRRYSPLVILAVIQLVVVLTAPSNVPTSVVSGSGSSSGYGTGASGTGSSAGSAGGASGATGAGATGGAGGATGSGTGSTAGAGGGSTSGAGSAATGGAAGPVSVGSSVIGSSSTGGQVTSCAGTQPAPWAYMPPCLKFSGTNGGASMTGVTSTAINFVWFEGSVPAALSAVASESGLSYTPDQLCEGLTAYTNDLNKAWQLYGRKFVPENGSGSHSGTAQGSNCRFPYYQSDNCGATDDACWRTQADNIAAMKPTPAFVITSTEGVPALVDELTKHHILDLGQPEADFFANARSPYIYDWQMSAENQAAFGAEYFCQKLVGKRVQYAGPEVMTSGSNPSQPPIRKIAVVYNEGTPDVWGPGEAEFVQRITACGAKGVQVFASSGDPSTVAQDMQTIAAKIRLGDYTTVYYYSDPISAVPFSNDLASENWYPEIVVSGGQAIDDDRLAELANPQVWRYAFGLSLTRYSLTSDQSDYYVAWKYSGESAAPFKLAQAMWQYFWMAGDMFEEAGPSPTVASIQTGIFHMPLVGGQPLHPAMKYGTPGDSYFGQQDVAEVYWCPTTTSPETNQPGTYIGVENNARFEHGQIDRTMRVFPNGVCNG